MTTQRGRRFCRACGHKLRAEDRFCGECGAPVEPVAPAEPGGAGEAPAPREPAKASEEPVTGDRRQVAILFTDLSGFTGFSRQLDPEDVHALLERFYEMVDQAIARFGGTIDKHIGDGVMALFGAPVAHGNDEERAVRAALAIHAGLEALSAELKLKLSCHIGIASGEVLASGMGSARRREYTVLGESVNLASRLLGAAGPDETVISELTHRAVGDLLDAEPVGPLDLKGIAEPVPAFRVRAIAPAGARQRRGAMIGRRAERRQIRDLIRSVKRTGEGAVVLVRGEAGLGKTRLIGHFGRLARKAGVSVHVGQVLDFGAAGGGALSAVARGLLKLSPGAGDDTRRAAAEAAVARGAVRADDRLFIYDLLDLPLTPEMRTTLDAMSTAARSEGRSQSLVRLIRARSRKRPRLIIIEDVHWADPATLSTLARIARGVRAAPCILVMTTRPEGDPIDASWRASAGGTPLVTMDLAPLSADEAARLAGRYLLAESREARHCIARAGGNPLFLEQLLLSARSGELERLPGSVQSVVLARIDRLEPPDRRTIQAASILGQRFAPEIVAHLLEVPIVSCEGLLRANLVFQQGAEFRFAHALIWEGVYGALLKRRRHEMHRRAAQWYATRDAALHAEHLERAQDKGAPAAYLAAARQQAEHYRHDAALALVRRGLALDPHASQRHALHLFEAEILRELGNGRLSARAARLAFKAASSDLEKARALIVVAEALRVLDRLDGALARLDRAERLLGKSDHPLERSRIHSLRGNLYFPMGKVAECLREHEAALMQAKFAASIEGEVRAHGGIADALYVQGRYRSSYEHFERCVAQAEAHGFGRLAIVNRPMLCATASLYGRLEDNRRHGARAIADAMRVGNKRAELVARTAFAIGELDAHAFDSLREQVAGCYKLLETIDAPRFFRQVQATEAAILLLSEGRSERASALVREALAGARQIPMTYLGPWMLGLLAYATVDEQERAAACQEAEAMIAAGVPYHNVVMYHSIVLQLHIERGAWDQVEHYARVLEDQLGPEPSPRSVHEIAVGKALVAFNRGGSTGLRDEFLRLMAEQEKTGKVFCRAALGAALARLEPAKA